MRDKIRSYIQSNMLIFEEDISFDDDDNIFQQGFVNSLFAVQLIAFLEQEFGIRIANEDLNIANFQSVNKTLEFVEQKLSEQK